MADLFDLPFFDITCINRKTYGYTKRDSSYRMPAYKGRPRYRLRDTWASYIITVQFEFTVDQYHEFQTFWYNEINAGLDPFLISAMLDDADFYNAGEIYQAQATQTFTSQFTSFNFWSVSIPLEIAGGFRTNLFDCPTVYGGPIDALATDIIYGGPITALATDVIIPCPGVDPNG